MSQSGTPSEIVISTQDEAISEIDDVVDDLNGLEGMFEENSYEEALATLQTCEDRMAAIRAYIEKQGGL